MIEKQGVSLISRSVAMLEERNITDISVITGYKSELIRRELQDRVNFFRFRARFTRLRVEVTQSAFYQGR